VVGTRAADVVEAVKKAASRRREKMPRGELTKPNDADKVTYAMEGTACLTKTCGD
jgi:hypothetical protein